MLAGMGADAAGEGAGGSIGIPLRVRLEHAAKKGGKRDEGMSLRCSHGGHCSKGPGGAVLFAQAAATNHFAVPNESTLMFHKKILKLVTVTRRTKWMKGGRGGKEEKEKERTDAPAGAR
jgi:hypothetical protein